MRKTPTKLVMGSKCSPLNQNTKNMNHYYVDTIKRKSVELPPGTPIRKSKSNSAKKSTIKTNAKQPEMDDQKDLELDVPNRKVINPHLRKRSTDKNFNNFININNDNTFINNSNINSNNSNNNNSNLNIFDSNKLNNNFLIIILIKIIKIIFLIIILNLILLILIKILIF